VYFVLINIRETRTGN